MRRPGAIWAREASSATRTASGTRPIPGHQRSEEIRLVTDATAPSMGKADRAGRSRLPHRATGGREDEDPVGEAECLGPARPE